MSSLIDKVASLLPALEEHGTVYLFAFAEREDVNLWDVVISADWADRDWAAAVRFIADLLGPRLEPQERTMIAQIAVIPSDNPTMQEMPESLHGIFPDDKKVVHVSLLGSDVRRAYIFKSQHPPTVSPGKSLVDAVAHA